MKTSLCISLFFCCLSVPAFAIIWSEPVLLPELNDSITGKIATDPFLTSEGLTIFFSRPDLNGDTRIMVATRNSVSEPFSNISEISELYVGKRLYSPWVSNDSLRMYYARHEDEVTKTVIHMAQRNSTSDPWQDVMAFTDIHESPIYDSYFSLTPDELTIYYSRYYGDTYHIWKAVRSSTGEQFSNPMAVTELNDGSYSYAPHIMSNELTIFYSSIRDGYDSRDLYMATRSSINDPFGNIERLNINSDSIVDTHPFVMSDYSSLYFYTSGGIYVSQQVPEPTAILLFLSGGILLRKKQK